MARRIKAEISAFQDYLKSLPSSTFSLSGWDVNEVLCQFSPPGGESQSITVSVPDDYPDIRPLAYTDGTFGVCCEKCGLPLPPPLDSATEAAAAPISASCASPMKLVAVEDEHDGYVVDDDAYLGVDDSYLGSATAVAAPVTEEPESVKKLMDKMRETRDFVQSGGTVQATDRLMKEYRALMKKDTRKDGFTAGIIDDNLYEWQVNLFGFDVKEPIGRDLKEYQSRFGLDHIELNIKFPPEYPFKPPFVRVVRPGILGGYVLEGGALCMELLTPMAYVMDALIPQLMATLVEGKARIIMQPNTHYDERVARSTFDYIVETHKRDGWYTPPKTKG